MNPQLRRLLDQYHTFNGRGNVISANETMIIIIEMLADMIESESESDIELASEAVADPPPPKVKGKVGRPRRS